jgi:plastocyanin
MHRQQFLKMAAAAAALALCATSAPAYEGGAVSDGGTIAGVVKFKGEAPKLKALEVTKDKAVCGKEKIADESLVVSSDGGIKNAVVSITNITKGKAFEETATVLDQKGCVYRPHILLVAANAPVKIKNSDGILHNIHTYSEKNSPINRAQPKFKKTIEEKFSEPEYVKVTCDAHGWMTGWFVVHDHPYYVITDETGAYSLAEVPAGEYELKVWHETLGETTQTVTVGAGAEAKADFELAAK